MNTVQKGRIGLSMAINYFTLNGYTVLLPLNDTQSYDMAIEKDGIIKTVQCKSTWEVSRNNPDGYVLSLRTIGGAKGTCYYTVTDTNVDFLFCYRGDGVMYLIPVDDIRSSNCKSIITLVTKRSKKSTALLETEKYIIS